MIYLDYSATTKTSSEVLDTFVKCSNDFFGNPNSLHTLGVKSKNIIDASTKQIQTLLNLCDCDVIYTSGASESNNLAIKGICDKYKNRGKHIITTKLEHSSILEPLNYLKTLGYIIDYVKLDSNGQVDLNDLENLMSDDTILVTISSVSSEVGVLQPIDDIGKIVSKYPKCFFHSDMTQSIGKVNIDMSKVDLISFSAHKFFGIKGIGALIMKNKVDLTPLIHGGDSTTIYRSGTPAVPLIVSLSKALRLALDNIEKKEKYVSNLNSYLKEKLSKYDKVKINSTSKSIPHILNISVINVKPETLLHALEEFEIYISTKSACSSKETISTSVYEITKDELRAKSSVRISLSYLTSMDEINRFIECFDKVYKRLTELR